MERECPKCKNKDSQVNAGYTSSGSQRCRCKKCNYKYTPAPKIKYTEETKQLAIKMYYSGVSGRGVGKVFGMSGNNVINWIKKTGEGVDTSKN